MFEGGSAEETAQAPADDVENRPRVPSELPDEEPHSQAEHSKDTQKRRHETVDMVGTRRRSAAIISALIAMAIVVPAIPAGADDPPPQATIVFDGGGFGHGVGMSQFGARAQALAGWTAEDITGFYYPGTEVVDSSELPIPEEEFNQPIWVGLDQHETTATLSWPGVTGTICIDPDPSNETNPCWRTVDVRIDEQIRFDWDADNDQCAITRIKANGKEVLLPKIAPECRVSATAEVGGAMWFGVYGYAVDSIELRRVPAAESFHIVAVIDLETYIAGLDEMPSPWPEEAQQAQILAARSYALNRYLAYENPDLRVPGDPGLREDEDLQRKSQCWCHVHDTDASQVYEGVEVTTPERVAAAAATAGEVIAYFGADAASYTRSNVIEALYSSSNAGRTMSNVDAFGSLKQYPYLIPIDDPWSIDPSAENPNATWSLERTPDFIADRLGWDEVRGVWLIGTDPSVVRFEGIDDGEIVSTELKGDALRGKANLLSAQVSAIRIGGVPTCNGYIATMWGTPGGDTLIGSAAHDVIVGKGGDDVIKGRGGHDVLCGNAGNDIIEGNNGVDRIYGGNNADVISGGGGSDIILAGGGADEVDGGNAADEIQGDAGDDTLNGGPGTDVIRGGKGMDVIDGQAGADELHGNAGDDQLLGGYHTDTLLGGPGADALDGGAGTDDDCRGGGGVDTATEECEIVTSVP